jgi:hypothetical protein
VKLGLQSASADVPGEIDYRLARRRALAEWRRGSLADHEVCDAQPELRRNAHYCGEPTGTPCPICADHELVHVTYVFGSRLPAHGRCVTSKAELARLRQRKAQSTAYTVEVCAACGWNHLVRAQILQPF